MKLIIFIVCIFLFFYVYELLSNKKIRNVKRTLRNNSKINKVNTVKKVIKQKSQERLEYEKKYSDIGLDIPKARKHSYLNKIFIKNQ